MKSVNSRVHTSTVCANLQVLTLEFTLSATSGARMSESGDQLLAMIGSSLVGCSTCLQRCQSVHKRALCLFKKTQISRLCAQAHVQQFCSNLHESDVLHKQSCNLVFNCQCMFCNGMCPDRSHTHLVEKICETSHRFVSVFNLLPESGVSLTTRFFLVCPKQRPPKKRRLNSSDLYICIGVCNLISGST